MKRRRLCQSMMREVGDDTKRTTFQWRYGLAFRAEGNSHARAKGVLKAKHLFMYIQVTDTPRTESSSGSFVSLL